MAIDPQSAGRWRRARGAGPLVVAHRGASRHELENTTAAFALAAAQGADGVELDVLLCASGEVVVFHDDDLLRLAGRPERVQALSLRSLRRVRLTGGGLSATMSTPTIPTLAEAFAACGSQLLVNVELKSTGWFDPAVPGLVDAVARVIDECAMAARVLVSSFDPRAVALWQRRCPQIPAALLIESGGAASLCKAMTLPFLAPVALHPEAVLCAPDRIEAWHRGNYLVNTWTVDDPAQLRYLAAAGVDGLITNDPARARATLVAAGRYPE